MTRDIERHPTVRNLRAKVRSLEYRVSELVDALNRTVPPTLEPVNPLPRGAFAPESGEVLTVHVDAARLRRNRAWNRREPLIRILHLSDVWHCHAIRGRSFELAERYGLPVPDRSQAVCVLTTSEPVEVVR